MNALLALIRRDLRIAVRSGGSLLTLISFYLAIGVVMPIAIGPDKELLSSLAPALIWIGVLLSMLLALDRMFVADFEDGSLNILRHAIVPLELVALGKLAVHWLVTALPLVILTPVMAVLFSMDAPTLGRAVGALLLGTPAIVALGGIGAAVAVSLKRGGFLAPILILPLCIPVLIFGVAAISPAAGAGSSGAALLFLSALSLLAVAFSPFAIALALRLAQD